ncbi:MAG: signal transduction protein [Desulfobacterales bacterium]|nr:MAG: signal transduction protein [Desulfobacterales bacterium]
MEIFVARQPVLTTEKKIFGYELLFRTSLDNAFPDIDGNAATSGVLSNTFFSFGLPDILDGKPGMINFTRDLLVRQVPLLFPKEHIIIEVLENIEPEPEVIAALKRIKSQGFRIALDDFVYDKKFEEMIDLCQMIKFDLMETPLDKLAPIVSTVLKNRPIQLLAEKVETYEEFEQAKSMGFCLFQGYFFSRPEILSKKGMTTNQITNLNLLSETGRLEPNLKTIEKLIKNDISVSFKLLKFINSTYFKRRVPIDTIKDAVTFMGINELKKFINVVVFSDLTPGKPNELFRYAVIRARMCEQCGSMLKTQYSGDELYTLGLFSAIDAILDMEMEDILLGITFSDRIKDALLGKDQLFNQLLELVISFEHANWHYQRFQTTEDCALIKSLPEFYMDAVKMADSFCKIL